jgi:sugar lactone lactonase YvrE
MKKTGTAVALLAAVTAIAAARAAEPAAPAVVKAEICEADGGRALCGYRQPEDLVRVPGTPWILVSQTASNGGLSVIDSRDKSRRQLFPAPDAALRFDRKLYADCPGPPPAADEFTVAGLAVRPGAGTVATVYGVGLRKRRAVEVFELDTGGATPRVTWIGCVPTPEPLGLNSVAPLPHGGFVTSKFLSRNRPMDEDVARAQAGEKNGDAWEWVPGRGYARVPGSEVAGANGVVVSKDGRWLYLVGWGSRTISRLALGGGAPQRRDADVGFRLDNIHWAEDGHIIGAGQSETAAGAATRVVKINPETLETTTLIEVADTPAFGQGSAAVEVGDEIWVGSPRRDRIGLFAHPATAAAPR